MTIEEFFSVQFGQKLYNKTESIFCIVSQALNIPTDQIPSIVTGRLNGENQTRYNISVRDYIYEGYIFDGYNQNYYTILNSEQCGLWEKISSINEIEDQKLINLIFMTEIAKIKYQLIQPVTVYPQQNATPPPINIPPVFIENSLNLQ